MKKKIILIIILNISFFGFSQTAIQKKEIVSKYSSEKINEIKAFMKKEAKENETKINKLINSGKAKRKITLKNGNTATLRSIVKDSIPIYYTLHNADAAKSTRTYFLNSGGALNLDLDGQNMTVGVWDEETVLETHQAFIKNGTSRISIEEPGTTDGFHATHVAGTIAASGEFNSQAKGMAPECNILSYDWNNDDFEVLSEGGNGLLISNHSYGTPVSESPAWYMGAYSSASRSWDQITRTEQYLLTVIAAGNDGNVTNPSPLQTGYDKLTGNAVSKNNLVVANAFDAPIGQSTGTIIGEVNINPSSSQGPTDDGRIKPDITGNGTDLLSTANFSNSSYDKSSGTSMASPNVAGTLILLQQYYNRLNGNFMYASTLKGLACHTADDILIDGPDAISGWGLLNALKAANTITKDFSGNGSSIIQENTMTNSNILEFEVQASGTENLEATICWTDIPGTATTSLNSNTPALVNDLDIRIIKNSNNTEYFPWKLNLANLNSPAIKGDNNVDNVEKVSVDNANGGDTYTIRVSHKGNLTGGFQTYSLIVTGIDATASTIGSKKNQFSIWPNPADNSVNFTSPNGFTDATIEIYDLNGRIVKTFNDINTSKTFSGDLTGMAAGVYVAKLNDGINGTIQKRIIKK